MGVLWTTTTRLRASLLRATATGAQLYGEVIIQCCMLMVKLNGGGGSGGGDDDLGTSFWGRLGSVGARAQRAVKTQVNIFSFLLFRTRF